MILKPSEFDQLESYLQTIFGSFHKKLIDRVKRWSCTVEPLNPTAYPKGNTKQIDRWDIPTELYPYLYSDKDTCYKALHRLLSQIVFMQDAPEILISDQIRSMLLQYDPSLERGVTCPLTGNSISFHYILTALQQSSRLGRSEINIDFVPSHTQESLSPEALQWTFPSYHLYELRSLFRGHSKLLQKVQTKAYLTDRRQTGDYPSNRERRWETNPLSPQFATYAECTRIEVKLLAQILEFSEAPSVQFAPEINTSIVNVTGTNIRSGNFRCPISGQFIHYDTFVIEVTEAEHGSSPYHVAHLIPLARADGQHVALNVSWITELGNRVQGEDAFENIVDKIFMMAQYHKERLGLTWQAVEQKIQQHEEVKQA